MARRLGGHFLRHAPSSEFEKFGIKVAAAALSLDKINALQVAASEPITNGEVSMPLMSGTPAEHQVIKAFG